ncbi:uncharacterized protein SOCEGT47_080600 [Sorangium cellulosum]|jgi:hypothetical protein|uniref:Secreted protein n=1 Tax=Sorangium cellulosum TaxID=56 RepID=A0A4P2QCT2_SORCE|nr:hypothetical protein [Sorangium cellulosum]AUX27469.1 uncharacterized protein SOCEGT47_080600 [Sorangium cellulosum]
MKFRPFHLGFALLVSAGAMTTIGCAPPVDAQGEQAVGTLSVPLVTSEGGDFRLHNAVFTVQSTSGAHAATLDSESDPDAATLTATLFQGPYRVRLEGGWDLARIEADGTESPVSAALISPNPQSFTISASETTDISFTFTTGQGTITLGNGSVDIGFAVAPNEGLGQCNLLSSSCASGQTCLLADATGRAFCASPGSLPVGSPCSSDQCVAGAQCLKVDEDDPEQGSCVKFCRVSSATFGVNCMSLGLPDSNIGFVAPAPEGTCDLLAQTGCAEGEACQYSGGSFATCGAPGTTPAGGACTGETCGAGYQCYNGVCTQICDTRNYYVGRADCMYCNNVGTGNAGRCSRY